MEGGRLGRVGALWRFPVKSLLGACWRTLHEDAEDRLGVYGRIRRPGVIHVRDEVVLDP